ncbi:MAG: hypothetical protein GVY16_03740 [Planctomycetes bacterium]|jgi:nitroreductase|nr:hypothetical protein [Planctomycetota bacterium]
MDLLDAIASGRRIRSFLPEPVARHDLERIPRAGIEAPSRRSMQRRQYIIVKAIHHHTFSGWRLGCI